MNKVNVVLGVLASGIVIAVLVDRWMLTPTGMIFHAVMISCISLGWYIGGYSAGRDAGRQADRDWLGCLKSEAEAQAKRRYRR